MSLLSLPTEIKLAIVDLLERRDVSSFALTSTVCHAYSVSALYRNVRLSSYSSLLAFTDVVPQHYWSHIRNLDVCNNGRVEAEHRSDTLEKLLRASPRLESLVLRLAGSPKPSIISCFSNMRSLKNLEIKNVCDEQITPLSERVAVSIATTIPALQSLSLSRISRSTLHAPELVGAYPCVPLVTNDSDVPPHPVLGDALSLPSLLTIPSLSKLTIHDTHLGDPLWSSTPVVCQIKTIQIGAFHLESDSFNRTCTERILAAVGDSISEFTLATSLSSTRKQNLKQLRRLNISSDVVVDDLVDTVSALSNSPVEDLSIECYETDVVDMFEALEEILAARVEPLSEFYGMLKNIDIRITSSTDCCDHEDNDSAREKLQEVCRDVNIQSAVSCGCA